MKNITLLALGIFIGAVGIVYILGPMSGSKTPDNISDPLAMADTSPSPDIIKPSIIPTPSASSGPVSSPKTTPVPFVSGKPTPISSPVASAVPTLVPSPIPTPSKPALTRNEISKHSTKNDCYLIINNKVYNISSYFGSHPGGDIIMLGNCGKEASEVFSAIHSNNAWDLLKKYLIGNLVAG